ncbi:SRPBCC family protein [Chitinophaga sp. Cy-1792]|uniref:SRPBCC family protein n=1 Tax=Chitinophaga sp. Cy-1792 TaxID=2608339 RepID=UPI00141EC071|nr:SRPBCC family protein [Chitinophaga sp. Cy-1792]NIG54019.1 SRPBCC family protein [Chitinophaga sp. Cy-1792]
MQAFFIILGALIVLILALFVFSMLLSSSVKVERVLLIPAPPERIFPFVNVIKNWELWSPWKEIDPNVKITYGEKDSGAGAGYTWDSKDRKIGRGSVVITASKENQSISTETDFMNMGVAKGYFRFEPAPGGTLVTWGSVTDMGQHPVRKLVGLMLDKWIGKDFEKGLSNLSRLATKR